MAYTQSTSRGDRGHDQDSIELATVMEPSPDTAVCKTEDSTDDMDPEPSTARLVLVLLGLWVGVLLSALDSTMLATIIEDICEEYDAFSSYSWVATTYPIGLSISQPFSGQLTNLLGRRYGLVLCLSVLAVGQLLCGLAPRLSVFLLGRIVQGLGAGCIGTITAFVETDLVSMRKRALIEGIGNITYGATLALGGVYGGGVANAIGWKWAFRIQVPFIILDIAMVAFYLNIPQGKSRPIRRPVDYVGMVALLVVIILFQFGMNAGGSVFAWNSAAVLTTLILAAVGFLAFLFWEFYKAENPHIPVRALLQRTVAASQLSSFFSNFGNTSIMYYVPVYLEVLGHSPGESGLRFIPLALCFALGSFAAGLFVKVTAKYYYINIPVQACSVLGAVMLCTMTQTTPSWAPFVYLGIYGAGSGGAYVTRLMGLLTSADKQHLAVVQSCSFTVRNTGTTIGQTISAAIFRNLSVNTLHILFGGQPDLADRISHNYNRLDLLSGLEKQTAIFIYLRATRGVFFLATSILVAAAVSTFVMQNNELVDSPRERQCAEEKGELKELKVKDEEEAPN
ncbi:multidrug resistance protein fnx1 [Aspergillus eucalypticola CBS 122712]|uniref:Multidrug resistance protein fnx1 n=1 Tax=Aspergillus eucalypticola (strain CBS 122712 / IBT 29274) TaxID=1448314 RepID=A0A317WD13_ASPEC|nr:multidrug resistance protein fnx1 [Aspergillus eucalypticola CBS 122712]PWY84416.1 multidrug resistance protein fnx1 [Aspergillus eucalypticola CBS 122712]